LDWHFGIQHIAAQTRYLRRYMESLLQNSVTALESTTAP
jgi:hypothetical protein